MPKLQDLLERPADRAPFITITGDPGVGKTTLACLFPKPVVLRTEDGLESIAAARRPYAFPLARTFADAMGYVEQLARESHPFLTLVVDSVTRLGSIIESEIIASDQRKPASINQALGGYGAGVNAAAERHRLFTLACQQLNEQKSMTIVYVAHSMLEQIDPPDSDSFTRYTLRLNKQSAAHYIDPVDAVAFIRVKLRYITKADEKRKRIAADSTRLITLHPTGAHLSKNRYGIEDVLEWDDTSSNPLLPLIPFYETLRKAKNTRSA